MINLYQKYPNDTKTSIGIPGIQILQHTRMHGNTCSCTYSNKQIHHQYNRIIQHYHSRRHVIVCAVLTQNQRRAATNESRRAKVLLHGGVPAVRHHELQWEIIFSGTCPMNSKKYVCWLHLATPWAFLLPVLALLVNVGSPYCRLLAVTLLRDASHHYPHYPRYLSSSVSSRAWNCSRKALNLGMLQQPMNLWFLWFPMTCPQFRLHTVQTRNLETRDALAGITHLNVKKKTSRYFQWVKNTWSFKVSVSQQTFSYI